MATTEANKRTPLHALHVELGGRMVPFAGWEMPVQYPAGIMKEHARCREQAALFDVSHMGQVHVRGAGAAAAFERLVPGNITGLKEGRVRYTVFTNDEGGIRDDLMVANAGDSLFVVVNAGCRDADIAHMRASLEPAFEVEELATRALIALQGPKSEAVLSRLAPGSEDLAFMQTAEMDVAGMACRVTRCGYTGEDGFEISVGSRDAEALARKLLDEPEVGPAGLGARDSLRLEAGLCLYGNDIDTTTTPVEAGLAWTIGKRRREEGRFPGAEVILRELSRGANRQLVGIRPEGRAPARAGTEIQSATDQRIGMVTSGGFGPTVAAPVAMGYVEAAFAEPGTPLVLIVRDRPVPAEVAPLPFVPHRYKR